MGATLEEGVPLKLVKKQGDAVSTAVVCGFKSGGPSLIHLELVCKFYSSGVSRVGLGGGGGGSKTRKSKWLVKVGASIVSTPRFKKIIGPGGFRATKKKTWIRHCIVWGSQTVEAYCKMDISLIGLFFDGTRTLGYVSL